MRENINASPMWRVNCILGTKSTGVRAYRKVCLAYVRAVTGEEKSAVDRVICRGGWQPGQRVGPPTSQFGPRITPSRWSEESLIIYQPLQLNLVTGTSYVCKGGQGQVGGGGGMGLQLVLWNGNPVRSDHSIESFNKKWTFSTFSPYLSSRATGLMFIHCYLIVVHQVDCFLIVNYQVAIRKRPRNAITLFSRVPEIRVSWWVWNSEVLSKKDIHHEQPGRWLIRSSDNSMPSHLYLRNYNGLVSSWLILRIIYMASFFLWSMVVFIIQHVSYFPWTKKTWNRNMLF